MKKRTLLWTLLICITIFFSSLPPVYAAGARGRILFISSYSYGWDTVQLQIEGIKAGVEPQFVVDYEFMDTKRVDDEISRRQFYDGLSYRMSQVEPYDVVILGDDAALQFALEYKDTLFKDIPLVFEGVNDEELALKAAEDPMITGIVEQLSVEKNIDLALSLNPKAKRVIAILDDTITGEAERKRFFACAEKYPELEFGEINASRLTTEELRSKISFLGRTSILIFVVMTEDASGRQYTGAEAIEMIVDNANIPVMRMVNSGIGSGLLGGNVVSMYKSGKLAASFATDIINGKDCSEINVMLESPNVYCLDENVMRKYGLNLNAIPAGAELINHRATFFERNKESLKLMISPMGALLLITAWIIYDNIRRRKLMQQLGITNKNLESKSQSDPLTGLSNRSKFEADLERNLSHEVPTTIMMLDIDDFKKINDTYGHAAGDEALKQVGMRLKGMESQILTAYRFAGDEFILILQSNQENLVEKTAYDCRQVFANKMMVDGEKRSITGSIGVASYPKDAATKEQLIVCADHAMYQVKKNGKNDFAYYRKDNEED